ncbi:MAG TPA: hypothetical protein VJ842_06550 [Pyrinomonadaceae bacterium]|nr:hypothetical protein [Pyrinomonadaceae bacterium]
MPFLKNLIISASAKSGKYLSNITYVLSTLLIYIAFSILTYIWLVIQLSPQRNKAAFIAYEMATGSDPYNFAIDLQGFFLLWNWILVFHIISWLIVPILAATAVEATFRVYEQRKQDLNEKLLTSMERIIGEYGGISQEEAERFAVEARKAIEIEIRKQKW